MKPAMRKTLLGAALVLTLLAIWYAPASPDEAGVAEPAPRRVVVAATADVQARRAPAPAFADVLTIRPRTPADGQQDPEAGLFAATRWTPAEAEAAPASAAAAETAQQAPVAPPLPFRVLGSYVQGGQVVVFLQQNDMNLVVRVGDTIGETYKVDSLDSSTLKLRYLPLDQVQTLELGRTLQDK
jgi:Tfp pilus assembly protein PilP